MAPVVVMPITLPRAPLPPPPPLLVSLVAGFRLVVALAAVTLPVLAFAFALVTAVVAAVVGALVAPGRGGKLVKILLPRVATAERGRARIGAPIRRLPASSIRVLLRRPGATGARHDTHDTHAV